MGSHNFASRTVLLIAGALSFAACLPVAGPGPRTSPTIVGGGGGRSLSNVYGPTVMSAERVVPVSGGTLLALRDGRTAVAADPDRDIVSIVDYGAGKMRLVGNASLPSGSEPGRSVEDGRGMVHVVLRSGGAIATIDPKTATVTATRNVCDVPRGLAWNDRTDELLVACAGGELVRIRPDAQLPIAVVKLDSDLRDVVVTSKGSIYVTRFRSAEVLQLEQDFSLIRRVVLPRYSSPSVRTGATFAPMVAFRAVALLDGSGIAVVHERGQVDLVGATVTPGYYSSDSSGRSSAAGGAIVHTTVTMLRDGAPPNVGPLIDHATLPVDIALDALANDFAVVAAGNLRVTASSGYDQVHNLLVGSATELSGTSTLQAEVVDVPPAPTASTADDQPTAVAYTPSGQLLVQSREPALLRLDGEALELSSDSRVDTGHLIFHARAGRFGPVACASCHAEGGDDGHTWHFAEGYRRTLSLRGGVSRRQPFHWDGGEQDLRALSDDVFSIRMTGALLDDSELGALGNWMDSVPQLRPATTVDQPAVTRGAALYNQFACASCHDVATQQFADVGTNEERGQLLKAPRLQGVAYRLPVIHNGCARTLGERFERESCGGGAAHGAAAGMTPAQIADLSAYLASM